MSLPIVSSPERAFDFFRPYIVADVEEFWAVALTCSKTPIAAEMIFRGTVDRCLIHPRDVFRFAIRKNAASIIVAHNHPAGDPSPSAEDKKVTARLLQAGRILEIPVDDHLILGSDGAFYSFMAKEKMRASIGNFSSAAIASSG